MLPLALLQIKIQPQTNLKVSRYELVFGKPYSVAAFPGSKEQIENQEIEQYLVSLGKSLNELKRFIILTEPVTFASTVLPVKKDWCHWDNDFFCLELRSCPTNDTELSS